MRLKKNILRYQLLGFADTMLGYVLMLVLMLVMQTVISFYLGARKINFSGADLMLILIMLIAGANRFKEQFLMLLQNGVTRKQLIAGRMLEGAGFAVIAELMRIPSYYIGMQMLGEEAVTPGIHLLGLQGFSLGAARICGYLAAFMLGQLAVGIIYRTPRKIAAILAVIFTIVVVGTPAVLDSTWGDEEVGAIARGIRHFIDFAGTPGMLPALCIAVMFLAGLGSWYLIKGMSVSAS